MSMHKPAANVMYIRVVTDPSRAPKKPTPSNPTCKSVIAAEMTFHKSLASAKRAALADIKSGIPSEIRRRTGTSTFGTFLPVAKFLKLNK